MTFSEPWIVFLQISAATRFHWWHIGGQDGFQNSPHWNGRDSFAETRLRKYIPEANEDCFCAKSQQMPRAQKNTNGSNTLIRKTAPIESLKPPRMISQLKSFRVIIEVLQEYQPALAERPTPLSPLIVEKKFNMDNQVSTIFIRELEKAGC